MYKQSVVIKDQRDQDYGKIGIVVAVSSGHCCDLPDDYENTVCKVLIGNVVSNWISDKYLETVCDYAIVSS